MVVKGLELWVWTTSGERRADDDAHSQSRLHDETPIKPLDTVAQGSVLTGDHFDESGGTQKLQSLPWSPFIRLFM